MKDESYLTLLLDDAVASVDLPPRERWFPASGARRSGVPLARGLGLFAAAAVLLLIGVFIGEQRGSQVGAPSAASPAVSQPTATAANPTPPSKAVETPATAAADAGWRLVRNSLPSDIPVLRPTWLPERYVGSPVSVDYAHNVGAWRYRIGYGVGDHTVLFALGAVNSARPNTTETVTLRGVSVTISTSSDWPAIQATWEESGGTYSIQSNDLTREELVRIIESLQAVVGG
jgi:hypothetical protein